jgi:hypothetical protein
LVLNVLRKATLLIVLTLAAMACGGSAAEGGPKVGTPAPSATGTRITVAGDSQNRYPTFHISRVDCGNAGSANAFISFVLPAAPAPSAIRGELLINVTASRATALNALYTLFTAPTGAAIDRSGALGPLTLQSTGIKDSGGAALSSGTLTVSGNYACP